MITLRPYQFKAVEDIRGAFREGAKSPLFVLATGGGKTCIFSHITHSAMERGRRVTILVHRIELIDQIVKALRAADVEPDVIAAGYLRHSSPVAVASVQTLARRIDRVSAPDLIVIDEAHHVAKGNTWAQILEAWPQAKRLGVTATPVRQDGRGLGEHFDQLIVGPQVSELIAMGYLTKPRVFAPPTVDTSGLHQRMGEYVQAEAEALVDRPSVTGDALEHYRRLADGKPAIVFCTSVEHAEHVAQSFRDGGYQAVSLNGGTDREVRRMAVKDFRTGALRVMASCDLFSEGFDVEGIEVGLLLRPTASFGLFLQQVGRCLRIAPGKTEALILDHSANCLRFGLPTDPREWKLTYDETTGKKKEPEIKARVCSSCFAASSARAKVCANCGVPFPVEPREVEQRKGNLEELTPEEMAQRMAKLHASREVGMSTSLAQLEEIGRKRGHKPGWAMHVWEAKQAAQAKRAQKAAPAPVNQ